MPGTAWQFITGTYDGTSLILYASGTQQSTTSFSYSGFTATGPIVVGHGTNYLNGSIDELRIYNRVLNATEVLALSKVTQ